MTTYTAHLRTANGVEYTHSETADPWASDPGPWTTRERAAVALLHYLMGACEVGVTVTAITETDDSAPAEREVILQALALPYADHPDYREEWR